MSLTKKQLIKHFKEGLKSLGYSEMRESQLGTAGFFCKSLDDGMYLTLGLEISHLYECRYTASFYWSMTTQWSTIGGDIPKDCYCRINKLMSEHEKEKAFGNDPLCWWNRLDNQSVDTFLHSIKVTELRLLCNGDLKERIIQSHDVQRLSMIAETIKSYYFNGFIVPPEFEYIYTPTHEIDGVPQRWFEITEFILRNIIKDERTNKYMVIIKASDAYRQFLLSCKHH